FPAGSTTITYAFTDVQGNTGSCSFQVVIGAPLSVVQDSIIHDTGNQHTGGVLVTVGGSTPGYTYLWTSNGQPVATTEDLSGVGMGEYTLLVTDPAGCTAQAGPFVVSNLSATDSPDWTGRVGVFPNPTTGKLFLQFPPEFAGIETYVAVYDATGREVLGRYFAGQSRVTLDLDRFADGFYALSVRAAGQRGMWKIAVMR
ncbi:MAG TPA: T9SS type A sorting domain-containing protein, partial [Saprospiraceae bacterium]|nr:T9SS type A sorting domain-containing protein [Saprospiraceae bacterium]